MIKFKDYKQFMNTFMISDIIVDNPRQSYVYMNEVEIFFQEKQYFKALMLLSCLIQSIIYELLVKKLPKPPQSFKSFEVKKIQDLPFKALIDWITGKSIPKRYNLVCYPYDWKTPLINEKEKLILTNLREIRNDMAHIPFLNYDANLRKEGIKKIIDEVYPIHDKVMEELIKSQQKKL